MRQSRIPRINECWLFLFLGQQDFVFLVPLHLGDDHLQVLVLKLPALLGDTPQQ